MMSGSDEAVVCATRGEPLREVVIRAGSPPVLNLREVWQYRELFWTLASRTVLSRYKQSFGGVFWAFARPIMTATILTIIFKRLASLDSGDVPYSLMVMAGVIPWTLFSIGLVNAANSMVSNTRLITKTYFPRIIIPTSGVVVALIEFFFGSIVLAVMLAWWRVVPTPAVVALPLFILLAMITAAGIGFWFSAINVLYRDVRQVVGYITGFGMLLSPVGFRSIAVSSDWHWQLVYAINPMVTVINGFRWALFGTGHVGPNHTALDPAQAAVSVVSALTLFVSGYLFFRWIEPRFADVI
jgi:lipopolysaccharide transport system permease protein